jgi:hypothetical protein
MPPEATGPREVQVADWSEQQGGGLSIGDSEEEVFERCQCAQQGHHDKVGEIFERS